ncbi:hypothetical protein, partial [Nocardia brasiliensis]|uniref:hypothetical protein n=1 Tax=Nocardia brasiliensis TaxID=37326 RepID=UPI0024546B62
LRFVLARASSPSPSPPPPPRAPPPPPPPPPPRLDRWTGFSVSFRRVCAVSRAAAPVSGE